MSLESTRPPHGGHGDRSLMVLLKHMREAVTGEGGAQERLDKAVKIIAAHLVADVCSIYLRSPDNQLELYATEGLRRDAVHRTRLGWGEGLVGVVAATQQPLSTADAPSHASFVYKPETGEDPLRSFLGAPLIRQGKVLGVLVLQNKAPRKHTDEEVEGAQQLALLLAEVAASGELLGKEATAAVGAVLRQADRVQGTGVVPGVAFGHAAFHEPPPSRHNVFTSDVALEAERLETALQDVRRSVDDMLADEGLAGVSREVLEAYRHFAYDRGWKERLRAAVFSGLTAESAVEQVKADNRQRMQHIRDPYLRERLHDLDDLSHRLLRALSGKDARPRQLPNDAILIARAMGPAELLEYPRAMLRGVVLAEGSAASHVAIVARALDLPLVAGADEAVERAFENDAVIIDGEAGDVHIRPGPDVAASYREKRELQSVRQAAYARERDVPAITKDGVAIALMMNAGLALDIPHLHAAGAEGVGLFRTELQFLIGKELPRAGAQERFYRDVLEKAGGRPVIFRTADLGGDKFASYMVRRPETNPAMGWRGLRLAVDRPGILRTQLRALIAATDGRPLQVMFPMVTLPSEVAAARRLLDLELGIRRRKGRKAPSSVAVGAMIETPAAAWRVEEIARQVDFLSVGGNDLAQFYFAADRQSDSVHRRYDPMDPGFLAFLDTLVAKAKASGKPLSYCGEHSSDPVMAAALIGLGVRRFSVPATSIGPFRRLILSLDAGEVGVFLRERMEANSETLRDELRRHILAAGAEVR
jgi:phosphotransferase system enzyme I (PtsP)